MTTRHRLPAPRAILFDWDNTLVDVWPAIQDSLNATFAAMGHPLWTLEETRQRVRKSLRDSFPEMFGDRWQEARSIFYKRYDEVHIAHLRPLAGATETLAWLSGEGLYLGVVSNKAGDYLRAEARELGWERYFDAVVGATDAAADKPAPDPVVLALAGSGIVPGPEVWFVGDGAIDAQCAANSGLTPVMLESPDVRAELARHNLDEFSLQYYFVTGMGGLRLLVEEARAAISKG